MRSVSDRTCLVSRKSDGACSVSDGARSVSDEARSVSDGACVVRDGARSVSDGARSVSDGARSVGEKKILFKNLYRVMEDYKVVDDEQGGFRRFRSTKRQLSKINCFLAGHLQRRCKTGLSVLTYWDIKNAFNAANHRVIFIVREAKGFPAADIDLIRQLNYGSFLSIGNLCRETAACFLARGYA